MNLFCILTFFVNHNFYLGYEFSQFSFVSHPITPSVLVPAFKLCHHLFQNLPNIDIDTAPATPASSEASHISIEAPKGGNEEEDEGEGHSSFRNYVAVKDTLLKQVVTYCNFSVMWDAFELRIAHSLKIY